MSRVGLLIAMAGLCLLAASPTIAADWTQDQFEVSASISENEGAGGSSRDYSWSFDGLWARHRQDRLFSITVDSDYSRQDTAGTKVDRLKTWFRHIYQDRPATEWNPVITLSTEGDHGFDSVLTLLAGGVRREFPRGFVELTGGGSKDVRSSEGWAADVGVLFHYHRSWKRLGLTVNPETSYGMLGEFRVRKERLRYTFDVSLDYTLTGKLGITYRLHRNNFTGSSQRRQYLGLTYKNN